MAGVVYDAYSAGDVNLTALMDATNTDRIGYHQLTLTELTTTTQPAIAAGSKIEVNGSLCEFQSEEAITGSPSDGAVYVIITAGSGTCTAAFTNTAPTWSDSKQGFYGTGGNSNKRYINYKLLKSSSNWHKYKIINNNWDTCTTQNSTYSTGTFSVLDDAGGAYFYSPVELGDTLKVYGTTTAYSSINVVGGDITADLQGGAGGTVNCHFINCYNEFTSLNLTSNTTFHTYVVCQIVIHTVSGGSAVLRTYYDSSNYVSDTVAAAGTLSKCLAPGKYYFTPGAGSATMNICGIFGSIAESGSSIWDQ